MPGPTRTNDDLLAVRKKHFLPTASHYHREPLQLVRAQGAHVWDEKGKRYLDAIGGIVCISAGHNHPRVKKALLEMLESDVPQHTSTLYLSRYVVEATERLLKEAPNGLDRVAFTNSGSEANELAFMASRQLTGENTVLHLRHSYHGGTSGTLAACGHGSWRFRSQPVAAVAAVMEPYCYRCPVGKTRGSCEVECANDVETVIQTVTNGKIAAMIAEPVMGVGGFIDPPKEYFEKVAATVHRYGGLYVSDEVQTGAGRCGGRFLLTTELGIDADIITMAKGLASGAPVGAVLMRSKVAESLAGKLYFNTFAGDPYQMMQAKIVMDVIEDEGMIRNARAQGDRIKEGLKDVMKRRRLVGDVRGRGLMLGMELVRDRETKVHATEETARLMDLCRDRGLLLGKGGLKGNVIRITPALTITPAEADEIVRTIDESLSVLEKEISP